MVEPRSQRPITLAQVVGILALALIVYFIIAFAGKAVSTYRLRAWRDELQAQIAVMELERQNLLLEIERRQSAAWLDEALKETGQVPSGVLAVRLVPIEDSDSQDTAPSAGQVLTETLAERVQHLDYFDNPNWRAWMALILQQD
ncbi:MAG: hypothetical protein ACOX2L_06800 [Anaerolineae bacterium]|jgi:hypothetical protein